MISKIRRGIRRAANAVNVEIHRYRPWQWSCSVEEYYPVTPVPRWGYGKPVHPKISQILDSRRKDISTLLGRMSQLSGILKTVPLEGDPNSETPYWKNGAFPYLDAAALITMLATYAPARYFEIGSGNSTKFARHTIKSAGLSTQIVSIDPQPVTAQIDGICDRIIRQRLEDCDLSLFDQLKAGDILFFDGSHRSFTNSDVTVFFLELMPRLKPGVIVHIHDIFLPSDYLPEWGRKMYSEQYLLAAMLLCPTQPFKVLLPNFYIECDAELRGQVPPLAPVTGGSFWIEMC